MAIIGGAGNPVGGSFTGPAQALEFVGNWAYAYSGLHDSDTTEFTLFSFTTGSHLIVGEFIFNGSVLFSADSHLGGNQAFKIAMNGVAISTTKIDTTGTDVGMPMTNNQAVVIPPYTEVLVTAISGEVSATEQVTAMFVGRVNPE